MSTFTLALISGKRKSGKTYIANKRAAEATYVECKQFAHADAAKRMAAEKYGLDAERLIRDNDYKEQHRSKIIEVCDAARAENPLVFCQKLRAEIEAWADDQEHGGVALITDLRLSAEYTFWRNFADDMDWEFFHTHVTASDDTRRARGWVFTPGVDDHYTETELEQDQSIIPDEVIRNDE